MTDQPNTALQSDIERYYEALHLWKISKNNTSQEQYWKQRVLELERELQYFK
jgi:hypothetical protein